MQCSKLVTRKGYHFSCSRKYTNGVPFLSKMVYKNVSSLIGLGEEPPRIKVRRVPPLHGQIGVILLYFTFFSKRCYSYNVNVIISC